MKPLSGSIFMGAAWAALAWAPTAAAQSQSPAANPANEPDAGASDVAGGDPAATDAAGSAQDLANQLANPVANLIQVPFQFNYDCCYGPADGDRLTINIQPVVPISISENWNLVTRTIVPIIFQGATVRGEGGDSGLGDTVQSFFLSPKDASNGVVWGVGPVILWPTGADAFSAEKFGAGPTAVVLKQNGGVTLGLLANHIWSFAGDDDRAGVSTTFIQPFITKTLPDSTAFGFNTEASYDWKRDSWTLPLNVTASHVYHLGGQLVNLGVGARYYVERPQGGPEWGLRFVATLLFPK